MKQFIILLGPSGSGKNTLSKEYAAKDNYYVSNIDKYIETDPDYLEEIKKLDIKANIELYKNNQNDLDTLSKKITSIYFSFRDGKKYNEQNEIDIVKHMNEGYNIVYEITGLNNQTIKNITQNLIFKETDSNINVHQYEISVLFPYVNYKNLGLRIINRFFSQCNNNQYNLRLPPVSQDILKKNEEMVFANLNELIRSTCVKKVTIFDNNYIMEKAIEININPSTKYTVYKNTDVLDEFIKKIEISVDLAYF